MERNPPSENDFGSDRVDKLPPEVDRGAAIALSWWVGLKVLSLSIYSDVEL